MSNIVIVERKYKQAYDSVRALLDILGDRSEWRELVDAHTDGDAIVDGDLKYVLGKTGSGESDAKTTNATVGSWFEGLRHYDLVSEKSRWESLMEKVSQAFHKLYSLVEYKEKKSDGSDESSLESCRAAVDKIFSTFIPDRAGFVECRPSLENAATDYYGVTLRIDVSGSTGASVPVLCKAYFQSVNNVMRPLAHDQAEGIDSYLKSCVDEASRTRDEGINIMSANTREDEDVIRGTITAVDNLLKSGGSGSVTFEDAIFFAGEEDENEIVQLVSQTAHNGATLKVVGAKILGISHVKWHEHIFDILSGGKQIFKMAVELGNIITMTCASCGRIVVNKSKVSFKNDDGETVTLRLHFGAGVDDCGLLPEEVDAVKEKVFDVHNYEVRCPKNFRNRNCSRLMCLTEDKVFYEEDPSTGQMRPYCKDCPYTEIVYTDMDGNQHYTPTLTYAVDVGDMVENDPTKPLKYCDTCGRKITTGTRCALCAKSVKRANDEEARKVYKKYGTMLPLTARLFVSPKAKRAYEDNEIILFCMGDKKRFVIRKAQIKDSGLNGKPERL